MGSNGPVRNESMMKWYMIHFIFVMRFLEYLIVDFVMQDSVVVK